MSGSGGVQGGRRYYSPGVGFAIVVAKEVVAASPLGAVVPRDREGVEERKEWLREGRRDVEWRFKSFRQTPDA